MYIKYQHIERWGSDETSGIDLGTCFVFPKIDGTNSQLWREGEEILGGSRNRQLDVHNDNQGFYNWALGQENFRALFNDHKHLRLFGEWLVPHFFKGYSAKAWRKFYIFDVMVFDERYLPYMEYSAILSKYNVEFIPPICSIDNPSYERLVGLLDKNYYLIDDGGEPGEGIVIKNYNYRNKFGRQTWAKLVRNEFKTLHAKFQVTELTEKKMVEQEIVDKYVTEALVNKEYEKIKAEDGWSSKLIPRLLNTVYYCLITEESWNFIKDHKNPIINYRTLNFLTINKIKALMPQLF